MEKLDIFRVYDMLIFKCLYIRIDNGNNYCMFANIIPDRIINYIIYNNHTIQIFID